MTLRTNLTAEKQAAHQVLDLARAGVPVSEVEIKRALVVLGDVV